MKEGGMRVRYSFIMVLKFLLVLMLVINGNISPSWKRF